jgi:hypothetical protein
VKTVLLILGIFAGIIILPNVSAEPSAQIIMEQTTFSYGQKLVYTIEVSEITGDLAIIPIKNRNSIPISL